MAVARVTGAKGLSGAVRVEPLTDWPERLAVGSELFLDGEPTARRVEALESGGRTPVIGLTGIATREAAEALRGRYLEVEARELPAGSYFWHQIVGLRVVGVSGKAIGTVAEVFRAGENEVYVVRRADRSELLVPALRSWVRSIDLAAGVLVVDDSVEEVG